MNTHTFAARSPSRAQGTDFSPRIVERLRAAFAALAAWRRNRALAHQSLCARHELAGLSAHVLRDIGARDGALSRTGTSADARTSALDLEIRG